MAGPLMLELREPPADGRAKWWGKPDAIKFYCPTGNKADNSWTQVLNAAYSSVLLLRAYASHACVGRVLERLTISRIQHREEQKT